MSQPDNFDRSLARWFDAEPRPGATAEVLDRALRATGRRRPRPRWFAAIGSRWVRDGVGPSWGVRSLGRTGVPASMALLLLLLILALTAAAILVGGRWIVPAPELPRLGHLAYALDDGLYIADWDGRNPTRIFSPSQLPDTIPVRCREFFGGPKWSPDGRHLAIRTDWSDLCAGSILITDAEGSSSTAVPAAGWSIAWSPDSRRIVTWVVWRETIAVYGIDGQRQALLPAPTDLMSSGGDHDASWTPDGSAAMVPYGVVVPLDGAAPYKGPQYPSSGWDVSPDGTRVAYRQGTSIVIAATDGSSQRMLGSVASFAVGQVEWSPTADRIAFQSGGAGAGIVDVVTDATTILDLPSGFSFVHVTGFAPEGDRILLEAVDAAGGSSSLWSVQTDGSSARQLVAGGQGGDWQWLLPGSHGR